MALGWRSDLGAVRPKTAKYSAADQSAAAAASDHSTGGHAAAHFAGADVVARAITTREPAAVHPARQRPWPGRALAEYADGEDTSA